MMTSNPENDSDDANEDGRSMKTLSMSQEEDSRRKSPGGRLQEEGSRRRAPGGRLQEEDRQVRQHPAAHPSSVINPTRQLLKLHQLLLLLFLSILTPTPPTEGSKFKSC